MGIRPQKASTPKLPIAQNVFEQTEMIYQDVHKMPCKLTSNTMLDKTRKPTLQNTKKQVISMSYSPKRITKGVKFFLQKFGVLGFILLKSP